MRDKWSALFVGRDTGLLAEYGNAWIGHPAHYSRVAVVSEAALDKANDHIEKIERDLRTFKNHCNTLDAELDARDAAIKQLTKLLLKARECLDREMPYLDSNKKWEDFCELVVEINRAIAGKEAG
jgi:hypothetical protein